VSAWLIDKSALVRLASSTDAEEWTARIQRGLVHIASVTLLEVGYSARSAEDLRGNMIRAPLALLPMAYQTPAVEDRAGAVQLLLADRGQHRAPSIPDLIVAATAELHGLVVLHYDKDFELIAAVTGQSVERVSLPSES